jgi:hypothetical protein
MRGELELSAEPNPSGLRSLASRRMPTPTVRLSYQITVHHSITIDIVPLLFVVARALCAATIGRGHPQKCRSRRAHWGRANSASDGSPRRKAGHEAGGTCYRRDGHRCRPSDDGRFRKTCRLRRLRQGRRSSVEPHGGGGRRTYTNRRSRIGLREAASVGGLFF